MDGPVNGPLLNLDPQYCDPIRRTLFSLFRKPLSKVLRLDTLNSMYSSLRDDAVDAPFIDRVLDLLGVRFVVDGQSANRVPRTGPVVAVCNHPFGVIEGLLLVRILREVRTDIKIMANFMLGMIPEMDQLLIEVDPFAAAGSARKNIAGLKASLQWLRRGGLLVVFPAGEVSSLKVRKAMVSDPAWSPMVGRIIRSSGAAVLPVFFEGRNSGLFQALGLIHPKLRTVMLPHENLKTASAHPIRVALGGIIDNARLAGFETDRDMVDYLRFRTYLLRKGNSSRAPFKAVGTGSAQQPIANSRGKRVLASEVAALPDASVLIRTAEFTVFEADAFRIPRLLREIGIRREETFRQVGEGTGKAMDIDAFDDTYRHLVLWNHREREVVGAYRFGLTDELLAAQGVSGLYTSTLFKYRPGLLESMGPALEMGRSFIIPKYQKHYQPLLLLWKGVAAFLVNNPKYTKLFGCVSISGDYSALSRELIMRFMERHCLRRDMVGMAVPRRPPRLKWLRKVDFELPESVFNDPDDVGDLVRDVEAGRPMPVLLKQYLKLGGKILGFNVDPDFGNCLDGLILVDLLQTGPKTLGRFMGREGMADFMAANADAIARKDGRRADRVPLRVVAA
jgi:Putative hemolysin